MLQKNVLAMSGRAVEAAGDVDTLLLDKTGTITLGNRQATEFIPAAGVDTTLLVSRAELASLADETPEGRSIVSLAQRLGSKESQLDRGGMIFVPFSATTRMSGIDRGDSSIRKGAADSVAAWCSPGGTAALPADVRERVDSIARSGGTPLVVAEDRKVLGTIHLKDIVKPDISERFEELRRMGLRTVMITGDNPLTAAAIAKEAGVDDFLAEATPENKLELIRQGTGPGEAGGDDRRRHQRRARTGPGRRGRGHEQRHPGGQGGRQPRRPRQQPDQADRDRGNGQADADHARRADDLLASPTTWPSTSPSSRRSSPERSR